MSLWILKVYLLERILFTLIIKKKKKKKEIKKKKKRNHQINKFRYVQLTESHFTITWYSPSVIIITSRIVILSQRQKDMTCLLAATQKRHTQAVSVLLKWGADTEIEDTFGRTPIILAAKDGNVDMIEELIKAGAHLNYRDACRGVTAVGWASEYDHPKVVEQLCVAGADLDSFCKVGKSAIHYAAMCSTDCMKILRQHAADIEHRDGNNATPLLTAAIYSQVSSIRLLLEWGAIIESNDDYGRTALTCNTNPLTVSLLLNWGANPNSIPNDGKTILTRAEEMQNNETIKILKDWYESKSNDSTDGVEEE